MLWKNQRVKVFIFAGLSMCKECYNSALKIKNTRAHTVSGHHKKVVCIMMEGHR